MSQNCADVMRRINAGEPTISIEDLGVVLNLGRSTAYAAVRDGEVPTIKVRGRYRIPSVWVRQLLQLEVTAPAAGP